MEATAGGTRREAATVNTVLGGALSAVLLRPTTRASASTKYSGGAGAKSPTVEMVGRVSVRDLTHPSIRAFKAKETVRVTRQPGATVATGVEAASSTRFPPGTQPASVGTGFCGPAAGAS